MDSCPTPAFFAETPAASGPRPMTETRPVNPHTRRIKGTAFRLMAATVSLAFCLNLPAQRVIPIPPPPNQPVRPADRVIVLKMRVEEGNVTTDITDAPLHQVLKELAERTGIVFEVRSQENPPVSIHLQHIPLQEAIRRIAGGNNVMFYFGEGAESDRIKMVRIFSRTNPGLQPSLLYLGTGTVTKTNNTLETPEQAIQVLGSDASIEDKESAIEILTKSKSDPAVKAMIVCISDPAPEIRVAAIEGLATMGAQAALPDIVKSLKDQNPGVRHSAVLAIAALGNSGNVKDLKPLSSDKDAGVAAATEIAIRKLSAPEKK